MSDERRWRLGPCLWAVLWTASAAVAAAPEKLFDEIFGAEARKVTATPGKTDDVEFAQKLLKAARTLTEAPALRVHLYEKAYEFGMRNAKGYSCARTALNLLDTAAPERKALWDEKRLELYTVLYRTSKGAARKPAGENYITQCLVVGDNKANAGLWSQATELYQQALTTATYLRSLQKAEAAERLATAGQMQQVEQLKARLKKDPEDAAARTALIRCYVHLDQPGWAIPYLKHPNVVEPWRTYVPLAAKAVDGLPTQVCWELGQWYHTLALGAPSNAKDVLAERARRYYVTYLGKAQAGGVAAGTLAEARKKINAALVQMGQERLPLHIASGTPAVQQAMQKAVAWLWSQQTPEGYWSGGSSSYSSTYGKGYYHTRPTAAALVALLAAGAKTTDKRVTKALNFLGSTNTPQTDGVAMRALVWYQALHQRSGIFGRGLRSDVNALLIATRNGGYSSSVTSSYAYSYNSYNWTPPIAIDAGVRMKVRVPRRYWQLVLSFWTRQQKANGGWAYSSSSSGSYGTPNCLWTVIGSSTAATCLRNLYGPEAVKRMSGPSFSPLKKGLDYLDKNLRSVVALKGRYSSIRSSSYYDRYGTLSDGLWCLSRLGLATGRSKIGGVEWARAGADYLVSVQKPDGSWGDVMATCRAMLFLVNCTKAAATGLAGTPTGTTRVPAAGDPARTAAMKRIELLRSRLARDPTSTAIAAEIVRLYVVELQDPESAGPYAARTGNSETPKLVALAAKGATALTEAQCLQLAEWYVQQAGAAGSSVPGRTHAYQRAEACYQRFLEVHSRGDADRLKAKLALQKVQAALAQLEKP